jgi:hypothetical protein
MDSFFFVCFWTDGVVCRSVEYENVDCWKFTDIMEKKYWNIGKHIFKTRRKWESKASTAQLLYKVTEEYNLKRRILWSERTESFSCGLILENMCVEEWKGTAMSTYEQTKIWAPVKIRCCQAQAQAQAQVRWNYDSMIYHYAYCAAPYGRWSLVTAWSVIRAT